MDQFLQYFNEYGIYLILLFVTLEYACFPLPSEIILPAAGAYAVSSGQNVFLIIMLCTICGLIGSLICYSLGLGGRNVIIKKILKKQSDELTSSVNTYNKYKNLSICFGRVIPLCRTYISFVAGLNRHNIISYITFTTIGIAIWNTVLILLGYNLFDNLSIIEVYYEKYKIGAIILAGIILIIVIIWIISKKRNTKKKIGAENNEE